MSKHSNYRKLNEKPETSSVSIETISKIDKVLITEPQHNQKEKFVPRIAKNPRKLRDRIFLRKTNLLPPKIEGTSSPSYQEKHRTSSLKKITLRYNLALFVRYLILITIIVPTNFAFLIILYWWNPFPNAFQIFLPIYIMLSVVSAFVAPYYYYNTIQKLRIRKKQLGLKSHIFQQVLRVFFTLTRIGKYVIKYGTIPLFCLLYGIYFYFSMPISYFILLIILDSLYYEYLLIKHIATGNISAIPRRVFTYITISCIFISSAIFIFNENIDVILFTFPIFFLLSSLPFSNSYFGNNPQILFKLFYYLVMDKFSTFYSSH